MHHFGDRLIEGFPQLFDEVVDRITHQPLTNVGEWQSQHDNEKFLMHELLHLTFQWEMPKSAKELAELTGARLPWAEDHFLERVGGQPLNPSPSEAWWPFREKKNNDTNASHKSEGEAFSHTYPERMWPKYGNKTEPKLGEVIKEFPHKGIRFEYGDLDDVVDQLGRTPMTRQAYLPIWFPEDTGAVHGKRVPCTLGYHFIIRDGKLDISYFMRSTDLLRHFQDDVYLAVRLAQWVAEQVTFRQGAEGSPHEIKVGSLIFHTANMHIFKPDVDMINFWKTQGKRWF